MNGPFGRTARFWRRIHLGRNPLARRSDRVEAALLLVVVLGLLLALPFAALVGTHTYGGQHALADQQRATRHQATATLIEDAPTSAAASDGVYVNGGIETTTGVHATWTVAGGAEKVGTITADPGTPAGAKVPVWLSDSGEPVPAPMTASDVTTTSMLAGIFTWLIAALALAGLYWATRLILDRRRSARWDREWAHVGNRWARS
ncbi:MAG TPA: hypothetical protein VHC18_04640 [Amycolatopsis sp.]|nr:hypothetical protein [Amycolatopsis sp.]